MPSITRRRLLGSGIAAAAGGYGAYRLHRGAADATFTSWTPAPGTWPLPRHDPANTAHSPTASPPRNPPTVRTVVSAATVANRPRFAPLVGTDTDLADGAQGEIERAVLDDAADAQVRLGPRALHANHAITVAHNFLDTDGYATY